MAALSANEKGTSVCCLGEIALRVNDLDAMYQFYEQIIRLPLMNRFPNSAFFKIAEGYGGHTQVLALFDRSESRVIGVRTLQLPPSTTSHSRYLSPISRTNGRDWSRWGSESKPPNTHGSIGARSM